MTSLTLLEGDCLQIMKTLPANSIDCFICDLPYGCLQGVLTDDLTAADWDIPLDLNIFWKEVKRLAKDDHTPVLMFCTTKFGYELIKSNPSWFRYDLVWDKLRGTSFLAANKMPLRGHEMIYVFSKKGATYTRVDISGDYKKWERKREKDISRCYSGVKMINTEGGDGKRCVRSVIYCDGHTSHSKGQHPTAKPLELYKWLIERYCPEGGTILDPTAGSFNSCFAAFDLNRHSIGIEMNNTYYTAASRKADTL